MTMTRRSALGTLGAASIGAVLWPSAAARAGSGRRPAAGPGLDAAIQQVIDRAGFEGSRWGMAFYSPDAGEYVYSMRPDEPFVAGSASKVFVAGPAFSALGPDHRFRTRVYRTGRVVRGVLHGDLVLVAGGDLLVGGRMRHDGTLILPDPDHSYGTTPGATSIPDPLAVLRRIAERVAARGVRRVTGRVRVDASLFREATGEIANGGIPFTISPMMVNDNIVDVTVRPGNHVGAAAVVDLSPDVGYVRVVNEVRTIAAAAPPRSLTFVDDAANPDGTRTVTLAGDIPVDTPSLFRAYYVPGPVRFAELAFAEALRDRGVDVAADPPDVETRRTARNRLVEYVSPPLSDQIRPMLKVSSNVHVATWPHVVGSIAAHDPANPVARYEELRRRLLEDAGLDPNPPGASDNRYAAEYFVRFLAHIQRQAYFSRYRAALPIMGRDGTLADVQVDSPAAGQVHAKTGTAMVPSGPEPAVHKALAGYLRLPGGRTIVFAVFVNVPIASPEAARELTRLAGEALGEIATAVYASLSSTTP